MPYLGAGNAGFLLNAIKFGAVTIAGKLQASFQKIVERAEIEEGDQLSPEARPVRRIDARVVYRYYAMDEVIPHDDDPATCSAEFTEANGADTGEVSFGDMVPGGYTDGITPKQDGFAAEQDFLLEGPLTEAAEI